MRQITTAAREIGSSARPNMGITTLDAKFCTGDGVARTMVVLGRRLFGTGSVEDWCEQGVVSITLQDKGARRSACPPYPARPSALSRKRGKR